MTSRSEAPRSVGRWLLWVLLFCACGQDNKGQEVEPEPCVSGFQMTEAGPCEPILCGIYSRVESNVCVPCSAGEIRSERDLASGPDTTCELVPQDCLATRGLTCDRYSMTELDTSELSGHTWRDTARGVIAGSDARVYKWAWTMTSNNGDWENSRIQFYPGLKGWDIAVRSGLMAATGSGYLADDPMSSSGGEDLARFKVISGDGEVTESALPVTEIPSVRKLRMDYNLLAAVSNEDDDYYDFQLWTIAADHLVPGPIFRPELPYESYGRASTGITSFKLLNDRLFVGFKVVALGATSSPRIVWSIRNMLTAPIIQEITSPVPQQGGGFGDSLDADTRVLVVGSPHASVSGLLNVGQVHVYKMDQDWTYVETIMESDFEKDDGFGWSVSIDGDLLVVGVPGRDVPSDIEGAPSIDSAGAVYVYHRDASRFVLKTILSSPNPLERGNFGYQVALHHDELFVSDPTARRFYVYRLLPPSN